MGERCGLLIKNEIREFKKDYSLKHPHKARWWWKEFFNNFIVLICWTKKVQERRGLDQSFTQPGCSKKCKGMTFRDFYADVEGTVKEFGYEPEKLLKFFRKITVVFIFFGKLLYKKMA